MRSKTLSLLPLLAFLAVEAAPAQSVKLITLGQISRVDKQTKSFELKSQAETNNRQDPLRGEITIGTTIGRTAPRTNDPFPRSDPGSGGPGRTFPGSTPRERPPLGDDPDRQPRGTYRQMIFMTEKTVCKEQSKSKVILCDELKVNDYLRVTGEDKSDTRGRGIYATEIVRTR
jgi:hypothetical protein